MDWGTALAPVYTAFDAGIPLHVWVDETRPRNQGASLTAWELGQHGVPHTVIVDNAGGHLMQHGMVDMAIVGCDRVTARGDVCNKIGTYLKALAAHDNGVPFYVALPTPTIDWTLQDGVKEIPIEERAAGRGDAYRRAVRRRAGAHRAGHAAGFARGQLRLRRDPGAAGDGVDHRARRGEGGCGGDARVTANGGRMNEMGLRRELVRIAQRLDQQGLNRGASGNLSVRYREGLLVTPPAWGPRG